MLRVCEERRGGRGVLLHGVPGERLEDAAQQHLHLAVVTRVVLVDYPAEPRVVLLVGGLPRLFLSQGCVFLGHGGQPLQDEAELDRHRLLAPERAVVVEDRDALLERDALRRTLGELDDRMRGRIVVPGAELRHPRAPLTASCILSSAWSIVKLAAF
jgi:hypothetical protein